MYYVLSVTLMSCLELNAWHLLTCAGPPDADVHVSPETTMKSTTHVLGAVMLVLMSCGALANDVPLRFCVRDCRWW